MGLGRLWVVDFEKCTECFSMWKPDVGDLPTSTNCVPQWKKLCGSADIHNMLFAMEQHFVNPHSFFQRLWGWDGGEGSGGEEFVVSPHRHNHPPFRLAQCSLHWSVLCASVIIHLPTCVL